MHRVVLISTYIHTYIYYIHTYIHTDIHTYMCNADFFKLFALVYEFSLNDDKSNEVRVREVFNLLFFSSSSMYVCVCVCMCIVHTLTYLLASAPSKSTNTYTSSSPHSINTLIKLTHLLALTHVPTYSLILRHSHTLVKPVVRVYYF